MPTSKQAKKRVRQSEKHRLRHKARRTELKTLEKKLLTVLTQEKDPKKAEAEIKLYQARLDKAGAAHTIHKNTVARRKSRLQRKLNKLKAGGAPSPSPAPKA
ncbi:30S ribosomal protein S20 [bacterium]|nr:30S ribosomal protein S20 [bacterium]